jgi:L-alanine-DL-glutamate epimerase-like enolase superfamily enzyme
MAKQLRRRDFLKSIPALSAVSLLGAPRAKITDVRIVNLRLVKEIGTYPDWVGGTRFSRIGGGAIIEIRTDQGVTGIGPDINPAQLAQIKSMLVGADPYDIGNHAARLSAMPSSGLRGPASVEIALWDLIGKLSNQPLYKLWGGGKEKVPPYSSMLRLSTPEERGELAGKLKSEGWQAVKWRCSFPTLKDDIRLVELTRKAVGDDWGIMCDGNKAGLRFGAARGVHWDFARAAATAREYQRMGVYFLEEPLARYDFDQIAELNRLHEMKIAGGEGNSGLHEFRWLLEKGCYDVVQPEIMVVGPTQMMKTAVIAESMNKMIIPHVGDMRLGTICNLHMIATWANCPYIEVFNEVPVGDYTYPFSIFEQPPVLDKQGFFQVPQGPGLGMTIKKEFLEKA